MSARSARPALPVELREKGCCKDMGKGSDAHRLQLTHTHKAETMSSASSHPQDCPQTQHPTACGAIRRERTNAPVNGVGEVNRVCSNYCGMVETQQMHPCMVEEVNRACLNHGASMAETANAAGNGVDKLKRDPKCGTSKNFGYVMVTQAESDFCT